MDLTKVKLPPELIETLDSIYKKVKLMDTGLDESTFIERIFDDWLEPYKRERKHTATLKNKVILRNKLKDAVKICGKTQTQIAKEMGINRAYLGQMINGKYEPSIFMVLLLIETIGYPLEKIRDLFYLEIIEQE